MSVAGEIGRWLSGPSLDRAAALSESVLRTRTGAGIIRAGIEYESLLRAQQEWCTGLATIATGRSTRRQRWIRSERALRLQLAPDRPAPVAGKPRVFWHGADRATAGRGVVVLINGWTASGLLWPAALVARLEQDFDVVRIDNRGTGYSRTAPAPFTIARLADDTHDVLRAIGAPSATIVGLSMGGMIAQELAINHPDVVDRLVLCGTRPPLPLGFSPAPSVLLAAMSAPRPGERVSEFLGRSWDAIAGPGFAARCPDARAELVSHLRQRPTPRSGVLDQMRAIGGWSGAHRIRRIAAPTVVVHGADDPLIPVGNGMRLAQSIPNARYVELPGVGHIVPYEAPDAVYTAITE